MRTMLLIIGVVPTPIEGVEKVTPRKHCTLIQACLIITFVVQYWYACSRGYPLMILTTRATA